MDRIASFTINHLDLMPGLYVSRRDAKGDCVTTTFDLRITAPNREPVVDTPALHTIEHLAATYLRNSEKKDDVIYFGPMGCRTGFYLLLAGDYTSKDIVPLMIRMFEFIRDFKDTLHQEQLIKVAKATPTEIFTALAGLIRKYYTNTWIERNHALSDNQEKIAYYFSIEFLPGRMLETNLLNLGILDLVKEGFAELDIDFREVVEAEHDMALGNGGLGRLAAAFMDSLATTGYPGFGNGLRYHY